MSVTSPLFVTGAAGFIGFSLSRRLLLEGRKIIGLDNLNSYYDPALKQARLSLLQSDPNFDFIQVDIADTTRLIDLFTTFKPEQVIHLAAQAGVRYSLTDPFAYEKSNLAGFLNILEGCRAIRTKHLLYASSSSVYGGNRKIPFSEQDRVDHPVSLYAATKKANELMAHSYSHLFAIPTTGLRFFTVYGPWGRPDMALFLFTRAILEGKPIKVFNHGQMQRDFTYIDDVVEAILRLLDRIPHSQPSLSTAETDSDVISTPYKIYNIGNNKPVELIHMIKILEEELGKKSEKIMLPLQPGDVPITFADIDTLYHDICFQPTTSLKDGIRAFVSWYRSFYQI